MRNPQKWNGLLLRYDNTGFQGLIEPRHTKTNCDDLREQSHGISRDIPLLEGAPVD